MRASPSKYPGPIGLMILILVLLAAHAWMLETSPPSALWGDEPMYAQNAAMDAQTGQTSLLPGRLPFRTQPEFGARLLSNFEQGAGLLQASTRLHMLLLGLTLVMLYQQARLLKLSPGFAWLAAALLGCFPWFGFHVHSLWPEVLHAFLSAAALLFLLLTLKRDRLFYLIPAGICIAFALFTKGVLQPFVLLFACVLGVHFWRLGRATGQAYAWRRALAAPLLLLGSMLFVLAPQLWSNHEAGHGMQLAANRWWNLELGLSANPREGRSIAKLQREYFEASPVDSEREALARQRTLKYLEQNGAWKVLKSQLVKLQRLIFLHPSSLELSLGKMQRWGPEPPAPLASLAVLGRGMWFALLLMGGIGALSLGRASSGWFLVGSFSAAFLAAALLVPLKVRFLMPLVPFLCLLSAGLLQQLWLRLSERSRSLPKS